MNSRRDFLKASMLAGGAMMLPSWARAGTGDVLQSSMPLRPFSQPMPIPPIVQDVAPFATNRVIPPNTVFHELQMVAGEHRFHPDLPPGLVWGYQDVMNTSAPLTPGPTFLSRDGVHVLARFHNRLPSNHRGFGVPNLAVHRHGGEQAPEDDPFPADHISPGEHFDYYYPEFDRPNDPRETQGTMWYHDHVADFTAQNVYRGLAGFYLRFSAMDTGNENQPGSTGLQLPSGPYDIGLAIQDRAFGFDGQLLYDSFSHNGFLGDHFIVNGVVTPYLRVKRRKYRFRLLGGCNARYLGLALSSGQRFVQIATEGGFLEFPIERDIITFGPGERHDVIIDFSRYMQGAEIVLENRMVQTTGRKPDGLATTGTPVMKFIVDGDAPDPSRIPMRLRDPLPRDFLFPAVRREFITGRSNGAWVINNKLWDPDTPQATVRLGDVEIWTFRNSSGGWAHPMHVHGSLSQILTRNGRPPAPWDAGMRDMVDLQPGDEVTFRVQFREFRGRYVFHCHNVEHEDMAMMTWFNVV